jgi:ubiquinone/menaquinone biosynthesis C-methylase UbiE
MSARGAKNTEAGFWDHRVRSFARGAPAERLIVKDDLVDNMISGIAYLGIHRLNRFVLECLGELEGRHVLDCGCGTGLLSVAMAQKGATVCAADLSLESLRMVRSRSKVNAVEARIHGVCTELEALAFQDASFDHAVGSLLLHHTTSLSTALEELLRVVRPGGKLLFVETSGKNPLLMFARRHILGRWGIEKAGTHQEEPLDGKKIEEIRRSAGGNLEVHYPEFIFFRMLPQYIARMRRDAAMKICSFMDRLVHERIPPLRAFGYYQVLVVKKP